jgi:hypothetical protein
MEVWDGQKEERRERAMGDLFVEVVLLLVVDDAEVVCILRMDLHGLHSARGDRDTRQRSESGRAGRSWGCRIDRAVSLCFQRRTQRRLLEQVREVNKKIKERDLKDQWCDFLVHSN